MSLDDLLVRYKLPMPELVKIDAKGFDLEVLQSAKTLLGETKVFLLEPAVLCPYENSVATAIQFMAEHGYRLIDITEINCSLKDNLLWLMELAFLHNLSTLLATASSYELAAVELRLLLLYYHDPEGGNGGSVSVYTAALVNTMFFLASEATAR